MNTRTILVDSEPKKRSAPARRRTAVTAGAALVLAVAVTGCGSSGSTTSATTAPPPSSAPTIVLSAYTQTIGAKTANISINEKLTETPAAQQTQHASVSGSGTIDFTNQTEELTFSSAASGTFSERFISPVLYINVPSSDRSQLPAGKSWAEINLNTVSEAKLGASLSQLTSSSQESTQVLSYLQAVSNSGITTVGPATIRGTATTEYKATIDLTNEAAGEKTPQAKAALEAIETELHTSAMPVQVWLDAQGRVRQISYELHASTTASSASSAGTTTPAATETVDTTIDYYDFGAPIDVSPPPAAETANLTNQVVAADTTTSTSG